MKAKLLYIVLISLVSIFALSVFTGLLGGRTTHYQCKYVTTVKVLVADHEKYTSAVYEVDYNDGTKGASNALGIDGPAGLDNGAVCQTRFEWGFPYHWTNSNIKNESVRKS